MVAAIRPAGKPDGALGAAEGPDRARASAAEATALREVAEETGAHGRLARRSSATSATGSTGTASGSSRSSRSSSSATRAARLGDIAGGVPPRGRRGALAAARGGAAAARVPGEREMAEKAVGCARRAGRMIARQCRLRPELLLAGRRGPASIAPQDGDDPARRQVAEVPEGDDRLGARRRPLRPAPARLRRRDRQGRGEARSASSRRARSSTTTRRSAAPRRWRTSSASSTTARSREEDTVTVIRFSAVKALDCGLLRSFRIGTPKSSGSRSCAPHSSQSTAKVDENGAAHDGQRWSISPPHAGHSPGLVLELVEPAPRGAAARQNAVQSPSTLRRSSRSQSEALPMVPDDSCGVTVVTRHGDRARGRAERLAAGGEGVGPRPRGSAPASTATCSITRGVEERGHILYRQGKIPGSFYTGRGNEAAAVGVATAMGPDDVGTPLHRDMGVHITRGVEPWRIFANYMGRADGPAKGRDGNVHMADARLGLIAMVSHLPAMLPVAVGCALAFRIREERRVAVALVRRGRGRARRHARGDELRRRPAAAGRLHLRQQPVGVLDADAPRVRGRAPRRPRAGLRLRGRRRRRHRRARRLPRGEARDREGTRGRRPDADRVPDAADGGPRRPRRRVLRPEGALRAVGASATRSSATARGCATTPT